MKRLDDDTFDRIAARMVEECERRGVDGVFAMVDLHNTYTMSNIRWMRCLRFDLIDDASDGLKYNVLAIALAKLAMLIARPDLKLSGRPVRHIGELPYLGGRVSTDGNFVYAFSGAKEEVDDEITQVAERFHKSLK